jgi:large subunit ribosomal protein L44e
MKLPKTRKTYCPFCKKHTEHSVAMAKRGGKRGSLKRGSIERTRLRGRARGFGNLGRYSRPTKPKMSGVKSSKKTDLRFKCKACGKTHVQKAGLRTKRVEFK